MGRSLGVVVVGWVTGFLIAIAWGATRVNNPRLASTMSGWAIAGMVVIGVLLLSIVVRDGAERRRDARMSARSTLLDDDVARAAAAAEERSAARIAELEALLSREQEELDAAVASVAATELAETGHITGGLAEAEPDSAAGELEPRLRQELVEAVAELVGRAETAPSAALAEELESRLEKAR